MRWSQFDFDVFARDTHRVGRDVGAHRRAGDLARLDVETGAMPGALHLIAFDHPLLFKYLVLIVENIF